MNSRGFALAAARQAQEFLTVRQKGGSKAKLRSSVFGYGLEPERHKNLGACGSNFPRFSSRSTHWP